MANLSAAANALLTQIIALLTDGITSFAQGIGGGINDYLEALFVDLTGETPALTTFGQIAIIFMAITLVIGVTSKIFAMLSRRTGM